MTPVKNLLILITLTFGLVACQPTEPISSPAERTAAETAVSATLPTTAPAPETTAAAPDPDGLGYITFAINIHDIIHVPESADTLLRLIDLFERYGVRGDFYVTALMVHYYVEQRPDVIERLRDSEMTISYHMRPPHPVYSGFDDLLRGLTGQELAATLLDYETYRLDMSTGQLLRDEPGGYTYVADVFGRSPAVATVPNARYTQAGQQLFAGLGAQMTLAYHESGTDPEQPFEWSNGLLIRPSDFSITRWPHPENPDPNQEPFWWNMLNTPLADDYNPARQLQAQLDDWDAARPPFVTVLIHENNFYRQAQTPFANIYWVDGDKSQPAAPPYDLNAPDASQPRSSENQELIWAAYEELVAYAAANLTVVTSEDIVAMANGGGETAVTEETAVSEETAVTEPAGDAPLFITTMTHMEGNFTDHTNQDIFLLHVNQLRYGMDLFDEYDAKMTVESEQPFAIANEQWNLNIMQEIVQRGHGVGTHCDIGFREPLMPVEEFAALLAENKALVDALVGPENNRGCSGAGGVNDWAVAASLAGFNYVNGIVGMHYLAMPLENRPDATWTDQYIQNVGYHTNAPLDLEARTHPFMIADALDFVPDDDGVILVSAGDLGRLDSMVEGPIVACSQKDCPLTREDVDLMIAQILEAASLHDGSSVGKISIYLPARNFISDNEDGLRYFLSEAQKLVDAGILSWGTQGDVYDAYMAWEGTS